MDYQRKGNVACTRTHKNEAGLPLIAITALLHFSIVHPMISRRRRRHALAAVVEIPPTRNSSVKPYNDGDHDTMSGGVLLPTESQPEYRDTIRYKTAKG